MAALKHILVGQSGGPTAAINASLAGVVAAARAEGAQVTGMRYGLRGFLAGRSVDLVAALPNLRALELLRRTPASWLGSCRFKLPDHAAPEAAAFYAEAFAAFEEAGVDAVFYIGGNDSMDTIAKLGAYGNATGSPIRFIGVPKTIDNDLEGTDHTPGYGSAARFVAMSVAEIARDADVYDLQSVTYVEIMGRDAGWLAGASVLAKPDLILLPEVPLDETALMERIAGLLEQKNSVVVGLSEGVRTKDGCLIAEQTVLPGTGLDEFGHLAALSGASRYLASVTKRALGCKTRAVELSTLQRSAANCASERDLDEAQELGYLAVRAARRGETAKMCAMERVGDKPYEIRYRTVDVDAVANKVRAVPRAWIASDGMGVTSEFVRYVAPLAGELPELLPAL